MSISNGKVALCFISTNYYFFFHSPVKLRPRQPCYIKIHVNKARLLLSIQGVIATELLVDLIYINLFFHGLWFRLWFKLEWMSFMWRPYKWPSVQSQTSVRLSGCIATVLCRLIFLPWRVDEQPWPPGPSAARGHAAPVSQEGLFLKAKPKRWAMIVKFMPALFHCATLKSYSCYNYILWMWLNNSPRVHTDFDPKKRACVISCHLSTLLKE